MSTTRVWSASLEPARIGARLNQQIATFPIQTAKVWGWQVTGKPETASTPGPTLLAYEGEKVRFVVTNDLPQPTSLHPHGTHEPNSADGVAGIDSPRSSRGTHSPTPPMSLAMPAPSPTTRTPTPRYRSRAAWSG